MFATLFVVAVHAGGGVKVKAPLLCTQATFGLGGITAQRKANGRALVSGACRWGPRGGSGQQLRKEWVVIA